MPEEAFLAGLLHDIGRTVMDQVLSTEYGEVLALVETGGSASWLRAEQRVCGFDHTHLGFVVVRAWEFPTAIAETIRLHHDPASASADQGLCATVSLANSLCAKAALGPDQQPDLDLVWCQKSAEGNPHAESELQPMFSAVSGRRGPVRPPTSLLHVAHLGRVLRLTGSRYAPFLPLVVENVCPHRTHR